MNFWALPPEITSTLIYSGPGSHPMTAAASAWSALHAEMKSAAVAYQSVISQLTSEEWMGPTSASMAAAVAPYVTWMEITAEQAEQAATRARAAAAAYETAHATAVPPAAVTANRVQLHQLVSTNVLGQNTAAIATTETEHHEMWAQDTIAMHSYHAQSTAATKFEPFSSPPNPTNPAGEAGQAGAVGQAAGSAAGTHASQAAPALAQSLQTPTTDPTAPATAPTPPTSPAGEILNDPGVKLANQGLANTVNTANLGARSMCAVWRGLSGATGTTKFMGESAAAAAKAAAGAAQGAAQGAAGAAEGAASAAGGLGGVAGGMGQAGSLGGLSVPPSWAPPAPPATALGPVSGGTWQPVGPLGATPMAPPAGMPGVPGAAAGTAGAGFRGFGAPRYGTQLTVMPRTSFGG